MKDIRTQLPECPLEYEVPEIPGGHTALVIRITKKDIAWQARMLPWTLASLINNTDIILQGVHPYIVCEGANVRSRVRKALTKFDLPENTITCMDGEQWAPFVLFRKDGQASYDSVCLLDINYWAFRGESDKGGLEIKLPLGLMLRHNWAFGVADYSFHPMNTVETKARWRTPTAHLHLSDPDSPEAHYQLANYFLDAGNRARWLHDANRAVYGEDYEKKKKNVAPYFFNESEPNWHLDASILHYQSVRVSMETDAWFTEWRHLGTDALIALWLLKTKQHAYNFKDSLMIEGTAYWNATGPEKSCGDGDRCNKVAEGTVWTAKPSKLAIPFYRPQYPRLCNMKAATQKGFVRAMRHLMGAQLNMAV